MTADKSPQDKKQQKRVLEKEEQITKNSLTDRSRIPDEQNAWKETQPQNKY